MTFYATVERSMNDDGGTTINKIKMGRTLNRKFLQEIFLLELKENLVLLT